MLYKSIKRISILSALCVSVPSTCQLSDFVCCFLFMQKCSLLSEVKARSGVDRTEGQGTQGSSCFWSPYLVLDPGQALGIQWRMR